MVHNHRTTGDSILMKGDNHPIRAMEMAAMTAVSTAEMKMHKHHSASRPNSPKEGNTRATKPMNAVSNHRNSRDNNHNGNLKEEATTAAEASQAAQQNGVTMEVAAMVVEEIMVAAEEEDSKTP